MPQVDYKQIKNKTHAATHQNGGSDEVAVAAAAANAIPKAGAGGSLAVAWYPDMVGDAGAGGTKGAVPAPGAGDAATKFLKANGTWAVPAGAAGAPTTANKGMAASVTAADFALACATAITSTPASDGYVQVAINGVLVEVGDGVRTKDCYFSSVASGGAAARAIADIAATDSLYWVGSVVGYELAASDKVDFFYMV